MFFVLFRKYPLFRTAVYAVFVVLAFFAIAFFAKKMKSPPKIQEINPPIAESGETISIFGENFGEDRGTSFVEIGGYRFTTSSYVFWSENEIRLVLPSLVQEGFLRVSTKDGKSNSIFFANSQNVPEITASQSHVPRPTILSVSSTSARIGSLLVIGGANFGAVRGKSAVIFRAESGSEVFADENDFDYESWSDNEIRVRVPNGAESGTLLVRTESGDSAERKLTVRMPGKKTLEQQKVYSIRIEQDIDEIKVSSPSLLTIRVPRPLEFFSQTNVKMNSCSPKSLIENFKNTVIHQVELKKSTQNKLHFSQDFVVTTQAICTKIEPKNVRAFSDKTRPLYKNSLEADSIVPCQNEKIVELAKDIVKKEKNPYLQAKLVYTWLVENCLINERLREADADVLSLLSRKSGDAYDFSIVFAALLRSLEIPAIPISGILINADHSSKVHWWNEFYIEGFGWVPVDVALGAGLSFEPFSDSISLKTEAKEFYFGNLDFQHIAFSRGWNEIRPSLANGKVVRYPRSFALQSIWEESNGTGVNYSSLWNPPIVLGVY